MAQCPFTLATGFMAHGLARRQSDYSVNAQVLNSLNLLIALPFHAAAICRSGVLVQMFRPEGCKIRIRKRQGRFAYNPALPPKASFETVAA